LASQACFGYLHARHFRASARRTGYLVLDRFSAPAGFRLVSSDEVRPGEGMPVRVVHRDIGRRMTFVPRWPKVSRGSDEHIMEVDLAFGQDHAKSRV
jgi:hypothetical protein